MTTSRQHERSRADYAERVRAAIERHKRYPRAARLRGFQGRVVVAFSVAADGSFSALRTDGPVPAEILARAALDAVRAAGRFEPIPARLGVAALDLEIPVVFSLE